MSDLFTRQSKWFEEYLEPHEELLCNWIKTRFSDIRDVEDIVQEAYLKVLKAHESTHINSPKAYLFATARNIALSKCKKSMSRQEVFLADFQLVDVLDNYADVSKEVTHSEELELLTKAIQTLPKRCRQVLTLRKIYGLSQKQVAKELGISENTVESQGAIGLRKLSLYFKRNAN